MHTGSSELSDRGVSVVHAHQHAWLLKLVSLHNNGRFVRVLGLEGNQEISGLLGHIVSGSILIAKSVTTDYDWLGPTRYQARNVSDNNRLTEYSAV